MSNSSVLGSDTLAHYRWHGVITASVLTGTGGNNAGAAGMMWKSRLYQYSTTAASGRYLSVDDVGLLTRTIPGEDIRVLITNLDFHTDTSWADSTRREVIDEVKGLFRTMFNAAQDLLVIHPATNFSFTGTVTEYVQHENVGLISAALLELQTEAAYRDRIIVVVGSNRAGGRLPMSNLYTGASEIAAPAESVATSDTLINGTYGSVYPSGTSMAAPLVGGLAGLALSMDPTLTPAQVKSYIVQGAQLGTINPATGASAPPIQIEPGVYEINAYNSLKLISKERPGTPVCGYPVKSNIQDHVSLFKNGPLQQASDSIRVPGAVSNLGWPGVAQGGRRLSVYAGIDALNSGGNSIITFSQLGQRIASDPFAYGKRVFLDGGAALVRQYQTPSGYGQDVTLSEGMTGAISELEMPDGSPAGYLVIDDIGVSPDGRFVSFTGARTGYAGVYVQRLSDQVTTAVWECVQPPNYPEAACGGKARWNHKGTILLIATKIPTENGNFTGGLLTYNVDQTPSGGFSVGQVVSLGSDQTVSGPFQYLGDDAAVWLCEGVPPLQTWTLRAANNLSNKVTSQVQCPLWDVVISNVIARP